MTDTSSATDDFWRDCIYTKEQCESDLVEVEKIYGTELGFNLDSVEDLRKQIVQHVYSQNVPHTEAYENWVHTWGTWVDWFNEGKSE